MPLQIADLLATVRGDNTGLLKSLAEGKAAVSAFADTSDVMLKRAGLALASFGVAFEGGKLIADTIDVAKNFQTMTTQVINNTTLGAAGLDVMRKGIVNLSMQSGASLTDMANGFRHAADYGYQSADAIKIMTVAMKSAVSTGATVESTTQALASTMHQYGASVDDAAKYMNVLHLASAQGNMTMQEFVDAGRRAISTAAVMHQPLTEVAAAFSALTRNGMDASQAGIALNGMLLNITHPTKAAQGEMEALSKTTGIDLKDAFAGVANGTVSLTTWLQLMQQATKGNVVQLAALNGVTTGNTAVTSTNIGAIMTMLAAQRGGLAALRLITSGNKDYQTILKSLNDTMSGQTDPTAQAYARSLGTLAVQQERMKAAVTAAGIAIGTVFLPVLTVANRLLADALGPIVLWTQAHAKMAAAILVSVTAFAALIGVATTLSIIIPMLGGGMAVLAGAIGLILSPITLAIAAVALLAVAWRENFGYIRDYAQPILSAFGVVLGDVGAAIGRFASALSSGGLLAALGTLGASFKQIGNDIGQALQVARFAIGDFVTSAITNLLSLPWGTFLANIEGVGARIISAVAGWAVAFGAWVGPALSALLAGAAQIALAVVGWIGAVGPRIISAVASWAVAFGSWLAGAYSALIDGEMRLLTMIVTWVEGVAPQIASTVAGWVAAIGSWMAPAAGQMTSGVASVLSGLWSSLSGAIGRIVSTVLPWAEAFIAWAVPAEGRLLGAEAHLIGIILSWIADQVGRLATQVGLWAEAFVGWAIPAGDRLLSAVGPLISRLLTWIGAQVGPLTAQVLSWAGAFVGWLADAEARWLAGAFGLIGRILTWIGAQVGPLTAQVAAWAAAFAAWIAPAGTQLLSGAASLAGRLFSWVGDQLGPLTQKVIGWAEAFLAWGIPAEERLLGAEAHLILRFLGWIADQVGTIASHVLQWAEAFAGWAIPAGETLLSNAAGLIGRLLSWIAAQAGPLAAQVLTWAEAFAGWAIPAGERILSSALTLIGRLLSWIGAQAGPIAAQVLSWGESFAGWAIPAGERLLSGVGALIGRLLSWIGQQAGPIAQQVLAWGEQFAGWAIPAGEKLLGNAAALIGRLLSWIGDQLGPIATQVLIWAGAFVGWAIPAADRLLSGLPALIGRLFDWIGQQVGPIGQQVLAWADAFAGWAIPGAERIISGAPALIGRLFSWIGQQVGPIGQQVLSWGEQFAGWVVPAGERLLSGVGALIGQLLSWIGQQVGPIAQQVLVWGAQFAGWAGPAAGAVLANVGTLIGRLFGWIGQQLPGIVAAVATWAQGFSAWIVPAAEVIIRDAGPVATKLFAWVSAQAAPLLAQLGVWATQFGAWVGPAATTFLQNWPTILDHVLSVIETAAGPILKQLGDWAVAFVEWIGPALPGILKALALIAAGIVVFIVETALVLAVHLYKWIDAFSAWVTPVAGKAIAGLEDFIGKVAVWILAQSAVLSAKLQTWVAAWLAGLPVIGPWLVKLGQFLDGITTWITTTATTITNDVVKWTAAFIGWIGPATSKAMSALGNMGDQIGGWVASTATMIVGRVAAWAKGLWDWVAAANTKLQAEISKIPGQIVASMGDLSHLLVDAGGKIIGGLISGITGKLGDLKNALGSVGHDIVSWKGPPTADAVLLYDAGASIMDGLIAGVNSRKGALQTQLAGINDDFHHSLDAQHSDQTRIQDLMTADNLKFNANMTAANAAGNAAEVASLIAAHHQEMAELSGFMSAVKTAQVGHYVTLLDGEKVYLSTSKAQTEGYYTVYQGSLQHHLLATAAMQTQGFADYLAKNHLFQTQDIQGEALYQKQKADTITAGMRTLLDGQKVALDAMTGLQAGYWTISNGLLQHQNASQAQMTTDGFKAMLTAQNLGYDGMVAGQVVYTQKAGQTLAAGMRTLLDGQKVALDAQANLQAGYWTISNGLLQHQNATALQMSTAGFAAMLAAQGLHYDSMIAGQAVYTQKAQETLAAGMRTLADGQKVALDAQANVQSGYWTVQNGLLQHQNATALQMQTAGFADMLKAQNLGYDSMIGGQAVYVARAGTTLAEGLKTLTDGQVAYYAAATSLQSGYWTESNGVLTHQNASALEMSTAGFAARMQAQSLYQDGSLSGQAIYAAKLGTSLTEGLKTLQDGQVAYYAAATNLQSGYWTAVNGVLTHQNATALEMSTASFTARLAAQNLYQDGSLSGQAVYAAKLGTSLTEGLKTLTDGQTAYYAAATNLQSGYWTEANGVLTHQNASALEMSTAGFAARLSAQNLYQDGSLAGQAIYAAKLGTSLSEGLKTLLDGQVAYYAAATNLQSGYWTDSNGVLTHQNATALEMSTAGFAARMSAQNLYQDGSLAGQAVYAAKLGTTLTEGLKTLLDGQQVYYAAATNLQSGYWTDSNGVLTHQNATALEMSTAGFAARMSAQNLFQDGSLAGQTVYAAHLGTTLAEGLKTLTDGQTAYYAAATNLQSGYFTLSNGVLTHQNATALEMSTAGFAARMTAQNLYQDGSLSGQAVYAAKLGTSLTEGLKTLTDGQVAYYAAATNLQSGYWTDSNGVLTHQNATALEMSTAGFAARMQAQNLYQDGSLAGESIYAAKLGTTLAEGLKKLTDGQVAYYAAATNLQSGYWTDSNGVLTHQNATALEMTSAGFAARMTAQNLYQDGSLAGQTVYAAKLGTSLSEGLKTLQDGQVAYYAAATNLQSGYFTNSNGVLTHQNATALEMSTVSFAARLATQNLYQDGSLAGQAVYSAKLGTSLTEGLKTLLDGQQVYYAAATNLQSGYWTDANGVLTHQNATALEMQSAGFAARMAAQNVYQDGSLAGQTVYAAKLNSTLAEGLKTLLDGQQVYYAAATNLQSGYWTDANGILTHQNATALELSSAGFAARMTAQNLYQDGSVAGQTVYAAKLSSTLAEGLKTLTDGQVAYYASVTNLQSGYWTMSQGVLTHQNATALELSSASFAARMTAQNLYQDGSLAGQTIYAAKLNSTLAEGLKTLADGQTAYYAAATNLQNGYWTEANGVLTHQNATALEMSTAGFAARLAAQNLYQDGSLSGQTIYAAKLNTTLAEGLKTLLDGQVAYYAAATNLQSGYWTEANGVLTHQNATALEMSTAGFAARMSAQNLFQDGSVAGQTVYAARLNTTLSEGLKTLTDGQVAYYAAATNLQSGYWTNSNGVLTHQNATALEMSTASFAARLTAQGLFQDGSLAGQAIYAAKLGTSLTEGLKTLTDGQVAYYAAATNLQTGYWTAANGVLTHQNATALEMSTASFAARLAAQNLFQDGSLSGQAVYAAKLGTSLTEGLRRLTDGQVAYYAAATNLQSGYWTESNGVLTHQNATALEMSTAGFAARLSAQGLFQDGSLSGQTIYAAKLNSTLAEGLKTLLDGQQVYYAAATNLQSGYWTDANGILTHQNATALEMTSAGFAVRMQAQNLYQDGSVAGQTVYAARLNTTLAEGLKTLLDGQVAYYAAATNLQSGYWTDSNGVLTHQNATALEMSTAGFAARLAAQNLYQDGSLSGQAVYAAKLNSTLAEGLKTLTDGQVAYYAAATNLQSGYWTEANGVLTHQNATALEMSTAGFAARMTAQNLFQDGSLSGQTVYAARLNTTLAEGLKTLTDGQVAYYAAATNLQSGYWTESNGVLTHQNATTLEMTSAGFAARMSAQNLFQDGSLSGQAIYAAKLGTSLSEGLKTLLDGQVAYYAAATNLQSGYWTESNGVLTHQNATALEMSTAGFAARMSAQNLFQDGSLAGQSVYAAKLGTSLSEGLKTLLDGQVAYYAAATNLQSGYWTDSNGVLTHQNATALEMSTAGFAARMAAQNMFQDGSLSGQAIYATKLGTTLTEGLKKLTDGQVAYYAAATNLQSGYWTEANGVLTHQNATALEMTSAGFTARLAAQNVYQDGSLAGQTVYAAKLGTSLSEGLKKLTDGQTAYYAAATNLQSGYWTEANGVLTHQNATALEMTSAGFAARMQAQNLYQDGSLAGQTVYAAKMGAAYKEQIITLANGQQAYLAAETNLQSGYYTVANGLLQHQNATILEMSTAGFAAQLAAQGDHFTSMLNGQRVYQQQAAEAIGEQLVILTNGQQAYLAADANLQTGYYTMQNGLLTHQNMTILEMQSQSFQLQMAAQGMGYVQLLNGQAVFEQQQAASMKEQMVTLTDGTQAYLAAQTGLQEGYFTVQNGVMTHQNATLLEMQSAGFQQQIQGQTLAYSQMLNGQLVFTDQSQSATATAAKAAGASYQWTTDQAAQYSAALIAAGQASVTATNAQAAGISAGVSASAVAVAAAQMKMTTAAQAAATTLTASGAQIASALGPATIGPALSGSVAAMTAGAAQMGSAATGWVAPAKTTLSGAYDPSVITSGLGSSLSAVTKGSQAIGAGMTSWLAPAATAIDTATQAMADNFTVTYEVIGIYTDAFAMLLTTSTKGWATMLTAWLPPATATIRADLATLTAAQTAWSTATTALFTTSTATFTLVLTQWVAPMAATVMTGFSSLLSQMAASCTAMTALFTTSTATFTTVLTAWIAPMSSTVLAGLSTLLAAITAWANATTAELTVAVATFTITLTAWLPPAAAILMGSFHDLTGTITAWAQALAALLVTQTVAFAATLTGWVPSAAAEVISQLQNMGAQMRSTLDQISADLTLHMQAAGAALMGGLEAGISSQMGVLVNQLHALSTLIVATKGPPDKDATLLQPAGIAVMTGLIAGIESLLPRLVRTLSQVSGTITSSLTQASASAAASTAAIGRSSGAIPGGPATSSSGAPSLAAQAFAGASVQQTTMHVQLIMDGHVLAEAVGRQLTTDKYVKVTLAR